jgi:NADPH:quinone reductase-like Zn-dependent oxidoreductase
MSYGNVAPGERVLIQAAAGGVGVIAVQLAKHAGAEVWGAASPQKHDFLKGLGVDTAVDYTRPDWQSDLPPFDLVMDAIGGTSFAQSYHMLRSGGRLVAFGAASAFDGGGRTSDGGDVADFRLIEGLSAANLIIDSKSLIGLDQRVLWDDRGTIEPWLAPLEPLLTAGDLKAVISEVLPFEEVAKAHEIISARINLGKVVLVTNT